MLVKHTAQVVPLKKRRTFLNYLSNISGVFVCRFCNTLWFFVQQIHGPCKCEVWYCPVWTSFVWPHHMAPNNVCKNNKYQIIFTVWYTYLGSLKIIVEMNCSEYGQLKISKVIPERGSVTKGQLILKCPFGDFQSPKKSTKFFQDFCPSL